MITILLKALLIYAAFVAFRYLFLGFKIYKSITRPKKKSHRRPPKGGDVIEAEYKIVKEEPQEAVD